MSLLVAEFISKILDLKKFKRINQLQCKSVATNFKYCQKRFSGRTSSNRYIFFNCLKEKGFKLENLDEINV